ncbi:peptidoglycan-binding domain-containing protein [Streptodolium elevatio]|uniref:Peptidoglycan-binding domain-containing protein n=1 Tax=Streptodolium elevatio TaxID=3157996 RepID=A0ABV3DU03_9ACTN
MDPAITPRTPHSATDSATRAPDRAREQAPDRRRHGGARGRVAGAAAAALFAVGASGAFAPAHAAPGLPDIGPSATGFGAQCVQAFYYSVGFSDFYPDAVYGPETTADTKRFERLLGLPQDGVVDPFVGSVMHTVIDLGSGEGAWKSVGCWYEVPSFW